MEKSNVRLISNVMVKKKLRNLRDIENYVPYELLPQSKRNVNNMWSLTPEQRIQLDRYLFTAKRIVDVDELSEEKM